MSHYRAKDNAIVDEDGRQIAVVLATNCTKKLAREMAAYAAQQANHAAQQKQRRAAAAGGQGESDSMADCYERAFTGGNRTAATWAAFQAGWNANKRSDEAIYANIAEHYHKSVWERRKAEAWAARDLNCGCDHNEYCGKCWPVEFRKGGEFYEWSRYSFPPLA